jgi:hypothetical protein
MEITVGLLVVYEGKLAIVLSIVLGNALILYIGPGGTDTVPVSKLAPWAWCPGILDRAAGYGR